MPKISNEEAAQLGISTSHELMANGERRFRLLDRDGLGYVRTEAGETGAWQNSHFHRSVTETYVVQSGWIAIATYAAGRLSLRVLRAGEIWSSPVGAVHNIYMPAKSVTHVVKHGVSAEGDWKTNADTEAMDRETKALSEQEILARAASQVP